jgi:MFS transporter
MRVQRTLPGPEDIGALAADHLPYQLPAVASLAHDLLDGYAIRRQSQDGRIGLLAAEIALILEALGGCQQLGSIVVAPMTVRIRLARQKSQGHISDAYPIVPFVNAAATADVWNPPPTTVQFPAPPNKCPLMATIYFFAYYGLATFLPTYLVSQGLTVTKASWWLFFSGLAGLMGNIIGSFLLDRIGRRWTITAMMVVAMSGAITLAALWGSLLHSNLILVPFFVLFVGANGPTGSGALFSEAFPTAIRTTGISASLQIARGMAFIPPLVVPLVLARWGYVPIVAVSACEFLFVCLWVWTFKETKDVDLQEIDEAAERTTSGSPSRSYVQATDVGLANSPLRH